MRDAKLIDADGNVIRQWKTDNSTLALTADRNCPVGCWVLLS